MINLKCKLDFDSNELDTITLKHKNSCTLEFLGAISVLMDEIEANEEITRKEILKLIKDFDSTWTRTPKEERNK